MTTAERQPGIGYQLVDMFAERSFAGSPLGVVPDADGLDAGAMQAIARELGAPETTFVLAPSSPAATYRVRVFTPREESPFGGHSSAGTAATLVRLGKIAAGPVIQECGARLLHLHATSDGATLTASAPLPSRALDAEPLLAACALDRADLAPAPPRLTGFGPAFHFLPVRPEALARAVNRVRDLPDLFLFTWDRERRTALARLFAPGYGIAEDPACASAALALGVWLVEAGWLAGGDGEQAYTVRQGIEVGRPATLAATVRVEAGRPLGATVSGRVIAVAAGTIVARELR